MELWFLEVRNRRECNREEGIEGGIRDVERLSVAASSWAGKRKTFIMVLFGRMTINKNNTCGSQKTRRILNIFTTKK